MKAIRPIIIATPKQIERVCAASHKDEKYVLWELRTQQKKIPKIARQIRDFVYYEGATFKN